ncbi:MAG TPA: DUF2079 domain-containing protein [Planctomycetaceae bacterium]|nr:DUF2079 domain-containing protein [Planctomycetaceae bacterium]
MLLGTLALGLHGTSLLRDEPLAGNLISRGLWQRLVPALGGTFTWDGDHAFARIDALALQSILIPFALTAWLGGAACIARSARVPYRQALAEWGFQGWLWWLLPLVWELLDLAIGLAGWLSVEALLVATLPMWHGLLWAGWLATGCALGRDRTPVPSLSSSSLRIPHVVWGAMVLYVVIFVSMNWGLYNALLLPHGDSAMYEEHLWNLLHGKGFRSYLDDGRLFLGEHIQVIHLLLIPLYLLWPSEPLLELCQSVALAGGAIFVYRIASRHGGSSQTGAAIAIAYLLYVPMQFLDIAIDLKTFRPNSFEIPLFLAAFDALETRSWRTFLGLLLLTLLCQEDAATIISPLGVWMALRGNPRIGNFSAEWRSGIPPVTSAPSGPSRIQFRDLLTAGAVRLAGVALALFGAVYLLLVIKMVLPWFRGGGDVHFAKYFDELGTSSNSIVLNILQHPQLVLRRLLSVESIGFALALLAPLGFLPLLSPGRLLVAAPLFGVLCLSDITNSPQHHFHAPLIPVLLWAAAAGLGNVPPLRDRFEFWSRKLRRSSPSADERRRIAAAQFAQSGKSLPADPQAAPVTPAVPPRDVRAIEIAALWCLLSSGGVGFFLGMSPAALGFWDPDSRAYWRTLYVPGERARHFPAVLAEIPPESRVASTDFIHPRFTHFDRSYDYSDYRPNVPDDADYIVIDTRHPYSRIRRPEEVKEYRDHPEEWELLPDQTDGYFIVLRRIGKKAENRR